jgi:hypothetical protein
MKKNLFTLFILLLSNWHLAHSQTVHALIYGDEKEAKGRGCDRKADTDNMDAFFNTIAEALGYQYNSVVNGSSNFKGRKAMSDIDNLNVASSDIVILYYTGHGYNPESNIDEWPALNFKDGDYHATKLRKQISSNAKLILFITDCCNNVLNLPLSEQSDARMNGQSANFKQNVKKLFTNFNGKKTVALTASQKGQLSYSKACGGDDNPGAFFGIAFREVFMNYATNKTNISWDQIIEGSKTLTASYTDQKQNAYGKIYTRTDKTAAPQPEQPAPQQRTTAQRQPATPTAAVAQRSQGAFYVMNGLGSGQLAENAAITIGNVSYYLNVNAQNPQAYITFQLPDGNYSYSIRTTLRCQYGQSYRDMSCTGSGNLYFQNGRTYTLSSNYDACNYQSINDLQLIAK